MSDIQYSNLESQFLLTSFQNSLAKLRPWNIQANSTGYKGLHSKISSFSGSRHISFSCYSIEGERNKDLFVWLQVKQLTLRVEIEMGRTEPPPGGQGYLGTHRKISPYTLPQHHSKCEASDSGMKVGSSYSGRGALGTPSSAGVNGTSAIRMI